MTPPTRGAQRLDISYDEDQTFHLQTAPERGYFPAFGCYSAPLKPIHRTNLLGDHTFRSIINV